MGGEGHPSLHAGEEGNFYAHSSRLEFTQVSLVCRRSGDQGRSGSGGRHRSWCHCTTCSLPLPHLLHVSWVRCGPEVEKRDLGGWEGLEWGRGWSGGESPASSQPWFQMSRNQGQGVALLQRLITKPLGLAPPVTCPSHSLQLQRVSKTLVPPARVKTHRKKAARTPVGVEDIHPAGGPASLVSDVGSLSCSLAPAFPGRSTVSLHSGCPQMSSSRSLFCVWKM